MNRKVLLIIFSLLLASCQTGNQVCIKQTCVNVEIADTPQERATGLMYREHLAENGGMLFIFNQEEKHSFWMKNTLIPLDIIWINASQDIVYIETAYPCQETCIPITPPDKALFVLEVVKGYTQNHSIKVGDRVEIRKNY